MPPSSKTSLVAACAAGDFDEVTSILNGPQEQWEGRLDDGLLEAVESANRPIIRLLLSKGAQFGDTSFHRLCISEDLGVFQEVFGEGGLDVNTLQFGGRFVLRSSVRKVHIMQWLLTNGADPNLKDGNGITPLVTAVAGGLCDSVDILVARGALLEPGILHKALWATTCKDVDHDIVENLVAKVPDINEVFVLRHGERPVYRGPIPEERGTPLHLAAKLDDAEAARILLNAGADTNVVVDDQTPSQLAESEDSREVLELLRAWTATMAPKDSTSVTRHS